MITYTAHNQCALWLALLMGISTIAFAEGITGNTAFDTTEWNWQASVQMDTGARGFQRIPLSLEILDRSQSSLHDLRILDAQNNLVPHVLHWPPITERSRKTWKSVQLINRSFTPEEHTRVTLDFGRQQRKNQIQVALSESNYRRKILVEGSEDGLQWYTVLEDQWLFDITLPDREFKVDTIEFPANNYRYLRLTAYNMEDDPRRIEFRQVDAALCETVRKKNLVPATAVVTPITPEEHEKNQTIMEFDLAYRNFPLDRIELRIDDPYFHRAYELLGRNAPTEKIQRKTETGWDETEREVPWRSVRRGILYRMQEGDEVTESVSIDELNAPYRYLKLRIYNQDNPSLQIDQFSFTRRETHSVVFQAKEDQAYRLIGGNRDARMPKYDLAQAVKGVADQDIAVVSLGGLTQISHEVPLPPFTERHAVVIWAVLLFAVAIMGLLILKNMAKIQAPDTGDKTE